MGSTVFSLAGSTNASMPTTVAPPIRFDWTPAQITTTCATELRRAEARFDAIARQRGPLTFGTVIEPYENISADVNDDLAAQLFLFQVSPHADVRTASQKCVTDVADFFSKQSARHDLYAVMLAAKTSNTAESKAQKKLLEIDLSGGQRSGAGLSDANRKTFVALELKINSDETKFAENLANDKSSITISPAQLAGLPPSLVASLKKTGDGNLIVPVNESTYLAFLKNQADSPARAEFETTFRKRGGNANVALLEDAITARTGVAKLLGYPNFLAYTLADRMAANPKRLTTFLKDLDVALRPKTLEEIGALRALQGGSPLYEGDFWFLDSQVRKSRYSVDDAEISRYFPAPHVIDAVLGIYSHLLGVTFTPAPQRARWNSDVTAYDVRDTKTGDFRGWFYLDLYPRPGKYGHFATFSPISRRTLPNGTVRPSVNAIVGNWPLPAGGNPSLLSHRDVLVFFHEFGHNVAALLANTPYQTLNSGFRLDFVEAPSQMLENFVWDPTILKQISSHVDTGATLPDGLIAKMMAARDFDQAYQTTVQIALSTIDATYHSSPLPVDTTAIWQQTLAEMTSTPSRDGTYGQASFGHLMQGYEAGYYGYLWSKVYAQDMFTAFKAGGLQNPAVGMRYRNDILAPARALEPDVEVTNFLGRPMSPAAYYSELKITPASKAP